ncbi:MAG: CDP-diacylglycerol--glycerol-3-phosphate 3-phosphatidyltransferase [Proteobacteria bacterium]|nr:CDP-diacylglycerol--glycerol-3-phosphate 3-phosphatidyltransferase [Pseudomonadota bacterium]
MLSSNKVRHQNGSPKHSRRNKKASSKKAPMSLSIKKDLFNLPNSITLLRIVLIPAVVVLVAMKTPFCCIIATSFFALAAISDFFDGYLARRLNLVSVTGKFLDPLADKLMVMAATVQLASMGWLDSWIPIVILTRELAVQGMRLIAVGEGLVIAAGSGGKIKTALQLIGLVGLLIHYEYPVSLFGFDTTMNFHRAGWWLLVVSIAFSLISAVQYFHGFVKAIDTRETEPKS